MHDRAVFGVVDRGTRKHGAAVRLQTTLPRHLHQQCKNMFIHQIFGQVRKHMGCYLAERGKAVRIIGKRSAQVKVAPCCGIGGVQGLPGRGP